MCRYAESAAMQNLPLRGMCGPCPSAIGRHIQPIGCTLRPQGAHLPEGHTLNVKFRYLRFLKLFLSVVGIDYELFCVG